VTEAKLDEFRNLMAEAHIAFGDRVRDICKAYTNDDLREFAADYERQAAESDLMRGEYTRWAERILAEVGVRIAFERAEPILAAGGAYCVAHDCDTNECWGKGMHS
jgi:hypothetical protein